MKFLLFLLDLSAVILVAKAEIGLIQIKGGSNEVAVEVCASFNNKLVPLSTVPPAKLSWNQWYQVIDVYPSYQCESIRRNYLEKFVFVKRGNCTFATKALNVQNSNGLGVIVVSDEALFTPYVNTSYEDSINITLGIITTESYNILKLAKRNFGVDNLRIFAYLPEYESKFDFSSIAIWCIAVITLAYGAWSQGSAKEKKTPLIPKPSAKLENSESKSDIFNENSDLSITPLVAFIFFFVSSGVLLLLYYFYDYIVYVIIAVFCYAGAASLFDLFVSKFENSPCFVRHRLPPNNIPFLKNRPPILSILLFIACSVFSICWVVYRNEDFSWIFQDILGAAFCVYVIKTISLGSFKMSTILLMLFFVYDIFYVFVTPLLTTDHKSIMVEVATGGVSKSEEELPMLFKLPKFDPPLTAKCFKRLYSLLGYGDIILPGLHVGYCAVLDVMRCQYSIVKTHTYYISALVGYGVGLVFTMIALYVMMIGQPALLYLVPCCLLSTLLVALKRKELKQVWNGKIKTDFPQPSSGIQEEENHRLL